MLGSVADVLINSSKFSRSIDGSPITVADTMASRYVSSINSVLYFVQLPLTLTDVAGLRKYLGIVNVNGRTYHKIEVRFSEENGGNDFEDVYLYWFEEKTFSMAFLAYSYATSGGGVRFRKSFNKRVVGGITFQDYINYKPRDTHTPLNEMSNLFQKGELIELSRIENVDIQVN